MESISETTAPATFLRHAYRLYLTKQVRQDLILPTLRILSSYLSTDNLGREPEALCAAALYLAFRHPNTYPNPVPRSYFASHSTKTTKRQPAAPLFSGPFDAKDSSIDWYAKRFIETLGIIVLYDEQGLPYFLERKGPIYRLIDALAEEAAFDAVLSLHVRDQPDLLEAVVDGLLDRILRALRLIPRVFRASLYDHLAPHVEVLMAKFKQTLGF